MHVHDLGEKDTGVFYQVSLADDVHVGRPESAQRFLGIDPVLPKCEENLLSRAWKKLWRAMPLR